CIVEDRDIDRSGKGGLGEFGRGAGIDEEGAPVAQEQSLVEGDGEIGHYLPQERKSDEMQACYTGIRFPAQGRGRRGNFFPALKVDKPPFLTYSSDPLSRGGAVR